MLAILGLVLKQGMLEAAGSDGSDGCASFQWETKTSWFDHSIQLYLTQSSQKHEMKLFLSRYESSQ